MISPIFATIIIVGFIIIFGVGVPILNHKAPKYISYRWCVVVVLLALTIGVVINFTSLSDGARHVVLLGGVIVAGGYIVLRTIEKILANGWLRGAQIEAKKGDISVKVSSAQPLDQNMGALENSLKLAEKDGENG
jgi:hypothetical protein